MIASIISGFLGLLVPLIDLFIKDYQKRQQLKDQMFRLAEKHSQNVLKNVQIRRDLEYLRDKIKNPDKGEGDDKKKS